MGKLKIQSFLMSKKETLDANAEVRKATSVGQEPDKKHLLRILDATGDTEIAWSNSDPKSIAEAKAQFEDFKKSGFLAIAPGSGDVRTRVLGDFDAEADTIVLSPPLVAG